MRILFSSVSRIVRSVLVFCVFPVLTIAVSASTSTSYKLVDPRIGTANDGQTVPVTGVPFGMTGWTPETRSIEAHCIAPYYYKDTQITGFRGSHWISGSCTQDYGSVTLMPTTGEIEGLPELRASSYRHESEIMSPAYYSTILDRYRIKVELTGTARSGMLRILFPKGSQGNILIEPNAKPGEGYVQVRPEANEIVGYNPVHRIYQGSGQSAGFSGYFVVRFQPPISHSGVWCGSEIHEGQNEQKGGCKRLGAYVSFPGWNGRELLVKVGTSFTSLEEAEKT